MNIDFISFQVHGGQVHGSNDNSVAGGVESLLTFIEGLLNQSPSDIFSSIFPGIGALANLHPLFVHFPIAFLTAFVFIDFIASILKKQAWRDAASWFLYFGTISALFTVIAGFIAEESIQHAGNVHEIMETHELLGISILSLSAFLSLWRYVSKAQIKREANILYQLFSIILLICISIGADLGGLMVYKYGVAVKAVENSDAMQDAFHQHEHGH